MSINGKKWVVLNDSLNDPIIKRIEDNRQFLHDKELDSFHDPYLFEDMEKAVNRIKEAVDKHQRIIIFGDYDVDGITGTAILMRVLRKLNANVSCRIPHREKDGYGISDKFIDEFIDKNIKLIISVDCGISCDTQILKAAQHGIDTIITDHHTIPNEIPDKAHAILHPQTEKSNYPYKDLTGSGVAFKLAHALIREYFPEEEHSLVNALVDLASMGTVADLGPLDGENRLIVKRGLKQLSQTKWLGIKKLLEVSNIDPSSDMDTSVIGFKIGPRINAAGRIASPLIPLSLLLKDEDDNQLHEYGAKLEELNQKRQQMTEKAINDAEARIITDKGNIPNIFISHDKDWHVGILGLIAGKLLEKYYRPSIIMQDMGDIYVGSARSPEIFNITSALEDSKEYLESFGGHSSAAGFNLKKENLEKFINRISSYSEARLKDLDMRPAIEIDCEAKAEELNLSLYDSINQFAPFGIKNKKPIFLIKNVDAHFVQSVGKDGRHLKFMISSPAGNVNAIAFNMGDHVEKIRENPNISLVCHLDKNIWKNSVSLQLHILDIALDNN